MLKRCLRRSLWAFAALLFCQSRADALVLDWDSVTTWNNGDLSHTEQVDPADPDSTVMIAVTPNGGAPIVPYSVAPNPMTPFVSAVFQGGRATIENTLTIAVNLTGVSQSISINVSFAASGGASDVSFTLFDIDAGGTAQDRLSSIQGVALDGSLIAPTITTGLDNTLVGVGLAQSVVGIANTPSTGLSSGRGNVSINFGSTQIQSFTFTFGATTAFADPGYQHFAVHDINFTPVPEMNPALTAALSCVVGSVFMVRRRVKRK